MKKSTYNYTYIMLALDGRKGESSSMLCTPLLINDDDDDDVVDDGDGGHHASSAPSSALRRMFLGDIAPMPQSSHPPIGSKGRAMTASSSSSNNNVTESETESDEGDAIEGYRERDDDDDDDDDGDGDEGGGGGGGGGKDFVYSHTGLTGAEAEVLLAKFGKNELPEKIVPRWRLFLDQFRAPMPIMIWIAIVIEAAITNWIDMGILLVIQFTNASISFYELNKAGNAVGALKNSLKPNAICRRNGMWAVVDATMLVPGDLVLLASGSGEFGKGDWKMKEGRTDAHVPLPDASLRRDTCQTRACHDVHKKYYLNPRSDFMLRFFSSLLTFPARLSRLRSKTAIPADCRVNSSEIDVDQAALTGESLPVTFYEGDSCKMGSTVVRGEVEATVEHTGADTFLGKTASLLASSGEHSHLQKVLTRIMIVLVVLSVTLCGASFVYLLSGGVPLRDALSFTVVLLVASVPLAIEIVTNATLAIGSKALAKRGAIVARLSAIEDLAGMSILCSDKTGTLTLNKMVLQDETPTYCSGETRETVLVYAALAAKWKEPPRDALDRLTLGSVNMDLLVDYEQIGKFGRMPQKNIYHSSFPFVGFESHPSLTVIFSSRSQSSSPSTRDSSARRAPSATGRRASCSRPPRARPTSSWDC